VARIEENAAAGDVQLTAEQVAALDELFDPANVAGARYPEAMFKTIQRD
jgi:diketogulonate reductase-like aldo/keto reductase